VKPRRKAREYALQLIFGLDLNRETVDWDRMGEFWKDKDEPEEVVSFTRELVSGTWENLARIDAEIVDSAANWSLGRMAAVDRGLMRLGAYELIFLDAIPASVTINEILEISKKYSALESASFINGILDRIARKHAGSEDDAGKPDSDTARERGDEKEGRPR